MFFGLLGDSTPRYQGPGASSARKSGGLLGFLSGLLGGTGTPTYVGGGQPSQTSGTGLRLFGGTPAYTQPSAEPATSVTPTAAVSEEEPVENPEAKKTTVTIIVQSAPEASGVGALQSLQDRVLDD